MSEPIPAYDRRYLGGILFFNARDFFEAHEVWENLWMECGPPEHRFIQALIQAAVALLHFGNGNWRGALKLYHSSRNYMKPFGSPHLGLDCEGFWQQMECCFAPLLNTAQPDASARPQEGLIPVITLEPAPEDWPSLSDFAELPE